MLIPPNIIATADDLGLTPAVNNGILYCFEQGYINSTSFLTNTIHFEETVNLINNNPCIRNIGVHVNLAEGKPVSNFKNTYFLDDDGSWDIKKTNKKIGFLNSRSKAAFLEEIYAQIDKALMAGVNIVHLDTHYHLHTLPAFYHLFLQTAKHYKLKLRLAQTYNEGSFLKFKYRQYINHWVKAGQLNYTDYFETVAKFLESNPANRSASIELMLHPYMTADNKLSDHLDAATITAWINFLKPDNKKHQY